MKNLILGHEHTFWIKCLPYQIFWSLSPVNIIIVHNNSNVNIWYHWCVIIETTRTKNPNMLSVRHGCKHMITNIISNVQVRNRIDSPKKLFLVEFWSSLIANFRKNQEKTLRLALEQHGQGHALISRRVDFSNNDYKICKRFQSGLPDPDCAKFGKYCQKSLLSKYFAKFFGNIFKAKNLPFLKYQLWPLILTKFIKLIVCRNMICCLRNRCN